MIGYSGFISREWFLIAWGADTHTQTHTHTHIPTFSRKRFQETRHAWFKNVLINFSKLEAKATVKLLRNT